MRTAERLGPLKQMMINSKQKPCRKRLEDMLVTLCSCFIPQTATKSTIYSCCCGCQIQCRQHRKLRLKISRNKQRIRRYDADDNEPVDKPTSLSANNSLPPEIQPATATATSILNKSHHNRRTRDKHLSAMLIVLNILYFLLNLPYNFHQTFRSRLYNNLSDECVMRFTHLLLDILQQTYFSTNFFLYVLTNRRFREEFYNTVRTIFPRHKASLLQKQRLHNRRNSYSLNQSTAIISNCHGDHPTIPIQTHPAHDSCETELELTELLTAPQPLQQVVVVVTGEANKLISKLASFNDSLDGNL